MDHQNCAASRGRITAHDLHRWSGDSFTKPVHFSSPDGITWNNNPEPYPAQLTDVISIEGYFGFSAGNFNGANVLLSDNGSWALYFNK